MYKPFAACTLPCRTIASNIPRLEIWNRIDTVYDAELGSGDITEQILESKMHWRNTLNVVVLERRTTTFHFSIFDVNLCRYSLFTFVNQWRRSLHDQELLMHSVEGCLNHHFNTCSVWRSCVVGSFSSVEGWTSTNKYTVWKVWYWGTCLSTRDMQAACMQVVTSYRIAST